MGVELLHQQGDHLLGERIHRHRIDVFRFDQRERIGQFVGRMGQLFDQISQLGFGSAATQIASQQQPQHNGCGEQDREQDRKTGVSVHRVFVGFMGRS